MAAAIDRATIVATTGVLFAQIRGSVVPMRFWRDAPQFVRERLGFVPTRWLPYYQLPS